MENNQFQEVYSKIVAKAWSDSQFKEKLLKNPENTLKEQGIDVPKGKQIKICENTDSETYLVLPQKPSGQFSEKELQEIAGGISGWPPCMAPIYAEGKPIYAEGGKKIY